MSAIRTLMGPLLALGLGCAAPAVPPGAGTPSDAGDYRIAPPDVLQISVRPEPEINRAVRVRPDGRISFDLIGDLKVEGRTIHEVQTELDQRLREFIVHPDVSVTLSESHSRHFFVFGEVRRPGKYPLIGNVTTLHALAAAGGATRFASLSSSRLVRPTPEQRLVYAVNLDEISRYGNGDTNYKLQPGDVVYIPPNAWARVGHALGVVFYPLQQILGLGRSTTVIMSGGGGGF